MQQKRPGAFMPQNGERKTGKHIMLIIENGQRTTLIASGNTGEDTGRRKGHSSRTQSDPVRNDVFKKILTGGFLLYPG